jgi:acyl-CoA dehydrogenase
MLISALERARLVATVIAARHADAVDSEGRFPAEAIAALKDARLLCAYVPASLGGEGLRVSDIGAICHRLGRSCGSTGLIYAMHQIQLACMVHHGQKASWHRNMLRRIASEQLLLASATTEGTTGGDLSRSDCAVCAEGDRFVVEKHGAVISYAAEADAILVTTRRAAEAPETDQVLVVVPRADIDLTVTASWNTLGMRGTCSNTHILHAHGITDQILPCPYGDIQNDTMVPFAHLTWSCVWLGIAVDALDRARRYLRGKPAAGFTPGHGRLVEASAAVQQMRANILNGLRTYETLLASPEPHASLAFLLSMNNLKISVSTGVLQVIQQALQICGISGYRTDSEFSVGRQLRDAHSASLMVANDRIAAGMGKMLLVQRTDPDLLA